MFSILFAFLLLLSGVAFYAKTNKIVPSISVPVEEISEEPPPESITPSLAFPKEVLEVEKDLEMIEADMNKMKEDPRLIPPSFIFSLGINN